MKKLKRLLLINWYNFDLQVIEFGTLSFITGKNSSGKSTIIDALQLIILGDTSGTYFNKAANEKSERTLLGYLYGEKGDDGGTGFRFKRNGDFASYIVAEFEDTVEHRLFSCGIVFDCYADHHYNHRWFVLDSMGLPDNLYVDEATNIPFFYKDLKRYLEGIYGKNSDHVQFTDMNREYRKISRGRFGNVQEKYRTLFRKAVPFAPISDIQEFIAEYVCEVPDKIDIESMKDVLVRYQQLEEDAKHTEELKEDLRMEIEAHDAYRKARDQEVLYRYIINRADLDRCIEQIRESDESREKLKENMSVIDEQLMELGSEISLLSEKCNETQLELKSSDEYRRRKSLQIEADDLRSRIDKAEREFGNVIDSIKQYGIKWSHIADMLKGQELCAEDDETDSLRRLISVNSDNVSDLDMGEVSAELSKWNEILNCARKELNDHLGELRKEQDLIETRISELEDGIKPYPDGVRNFLEELRERLSSLYGYPVEPKILSDLIEIRDDAWQEPIEHLLAKERFTVFVPDEMTEDAISILDEMGDSSAGASVADKPCIKSAGIIPDADSVANMIETGDPEARKYIDHILCDVLMTDSEHMLTCGAKKFLTKESVVRMNDTVYRLALEEPDYFIGNKSMEIMIRKLESQMIDVKKEIIEHENMLRKVMAEVRTEYMNGYQANAFARIVSDHENVDEMEDKLQDVISELESLDFDRLEQLKTEISDLTQLINSKSACRDSLNRQQGALNSELEAVENRIVELKDKAENRRKYIETEFHAPWDREKGEKEYGIVISHSTFGLIAEIYPEMLKEASRNAETSKRKRDDLRHKYLDASHKSYAYDLEDNEQYQKDYDNLIAYDLPKYEKRIAEAVSLARQQFQNEFIARLKRNIDSAKMQIDQLNGALSSSTFGTDSYKLTYKPEPSLRNYYDMIMDPLVMSWREGDQVNLLTSSFADKYRVELESLFDLIAEPDNETGEKAEERRQKIAKFTDYKSYLELDMTVTDINGYTQRLSVMMKKKSGGETQVPVYIALLASFSEICRVNYRTENNRIRLIVLDEAFSKMDKDRIRESLKLLRKFGLQAIFSAPDDKLQDIAPLVDSNTVVFREDRDSYARNFTLSELLREKAVK